MVSMPLGWPASWLWGPNLAPCAARVTVVDSVCLSVRPSVCLSVCLSVRLSDKSHLTSGASVRPENTVMYSAGNEGENLVGFSRKLLRCRDLVLPAFSLCSKTRMH